MSLDLGFASCYGLSCVSVKFVWWNSDSWYFRLWLYLEIRFLKEVIKFKWGHSGSPQSNMMDALYQKRRLGYRHTQREDHVGTQGEDGRLQASEWGLRTDQLSWCFTLRLLVSRIYFCFFNRPVCGPLLWQLEQKLIHLCLSLTYWLLRYDTDSCCNAQAFPCVSQQFLTRNNCGFCLSPPNIWIVTMVGGRYAYLYLMGRGQISYNIQCNCHRPTPNQEFPIVPRLRNLGAAEDTSLSLPSSLLPVRTLVWFASAGRG